MVKALLCAAALACLLLTSLYTQAQEQQFPALTGRVVDLAGILTPAVEASLSESLAAHESTTSNQIVVATLPTLEGYDIADYANRLGRFWQLGTLEEDNGVLLLVAPNDRKVRIEVGYGLEGTLPDALASIIVQREILPAFRGGNYSQGIEQGVRAVLDAVEGEYTASANGTGTGNTDQISTQVGNFLPLIFIAMIAVTEILRRTGRRKAANGAFPAGFGGLFGTLITGNLLIGLIIAIILFLFIYFKGSSNGPGGTPGRRGRGGYIGGGGLGGGFGGGGGFSGGGGSFGGGGASGSW